MAWSIIVIEAFVKVTRTIRKHPDGILAAIRRGINNARARGFHAPAAALALVVLACGPITRQLPYEQRVDRSD